MQLDSQTVKRIAELSRLELSNEEVAKYQSDLEKILQAFADLAQIPLPSELNGDARSALMMKQVGTSNEDISRMQKDAENNRISSQTFLEQAPEREGVFVRVPAILNSTT